MTEHELETVIRIFERALLLGAPGLSIPTKNRIVRKASIRLRRQLKMPEPRPSDLCGNDWSFDRRRIRSSVAVTTATFLVQFFGKVPSLYPRLEP